MEILNLLADSKSGDNIQAAVAAVEAVEIEVEGEAPVEIHFEICRPPCWAFRNFNSYDSHGTPASLVRLHLE